MNAMWIFLILFALTGLVHVTAILSGKRTLRRISKAFIIPFLLAVYIAGAGTWPLFPIFALVFGWMGDLLLIRIDKKICFKLGLASFLLGHLFYIICFMWFLGFFGFGGAVKVNVMVMAFSIPLAIAGGIILLRLIKPTKEMFIPVIVYMIVIVTLTLWGLQVFIFNPGFAGALVFFGCLSFMLSDSILAYYTFRMQNRKSSALLMSFYMLAQAGIILGVIALSPGIFTLI